MTEDAQPVNFRIHHSNRVLGVLPWLSTISSQIYLPRQAPKSVLIFIPAGQVRNGDDLKQSYLQDKLARGVQPNMLWHKCSQRIIDHYLAITATIETELQVSISDDPKTKPAQETPDQTLERFIPAYVGSSRPPYTILTTPEGVEPASQVLRRMGIGIEGVIDLSNPTH